MKKQAKAMDICLACWHAETAAAHAKDLKASGFRVHVVDKAMGGWIGYFRQLAVDAVVIDLDRLPSQGREVGILLRGSKSTRHLPLVYLGGLPEKVDRLRLELPDATYAAWDDAVTAIRSAVAHPVEQPVRPVQIMERSSGSDLARRLGIGDGVQVIGWGETDFLQQLLPEGVKILARAAAAKPEAALLWLCAVRTLREVEAAFDAMDAALRPKTTGWIVHPKQTSRYRTDFNQNDVRDAGLARGWVDFKVCAVDQDWSGLKFARRKLEEPPRKSPMRTSKVNIARGKP